MKDLVIVGASGFGQEVLWLAERCGRNVLGFLDDTTDKQGTKLLGSPILGVIDSWISYKDCEFIIAIGSPRARKSVASRMELADKPAYATLIDPNALIGKNTVVQQGSVICAGVICTTSINIGQHVIINLNSTIGHESALGNYCTVAPNASISGNVHIGDLVEIGTGATIREKININDGSIVGMGSVLTKDVESEKMVVGNPARVIKSVE